MTSQSRLKLVEVAAGLFYHGIKILEDAVDGMKREQFFKDHLIHNLMDMTNGTDNRLASIKTLIDTISNESREENFKVEEFIEAQLKNNGN